MKKLNNKGFGVVEGVLILVAVAIIGVVGWRVWQNNKDKQQPAQDAVSAPSKVSKIPDSEIKSGSGEWNTYINHKLSFSIQIPKKIAASGGSPCVKEDYVYDNYGEKTSAPSHYSTDIGVVPAVVVEDGNDFYVTSEYTYQQTGLYDYGDGYRLATGCKKVETNAAVIAETRKTDTSYVVDKLPFSVVDVKDQADIAGWVQKHFGKDVFVTGTQADPHGWENVKLDCKKGTEFCLNFAFQLRYYKAKNRLVYLEQGQGGQIAKPDKENYYDGEIFDSFQLN